MNMTPDEGRAWLELLANMAPLLRDQGITQVELGPLKVSIALVEVIQIPGTPPPARASFDDDPVDTGGLAADPLDDPDTYDGKRAPGFEALEG